MSLLSSEVEAEHIVVKFSKIKSDTKEDLPVCCRQLCRLIFAVVMDSMGLMLRCSKSVWACGKTGCRNVCVEMGTFEIGNGCSGSHK